MWPSSPAGEVHAMISISGAARGIVRRAGLMAIAAVCADGGDTGARAGAVAGNAGCGAGSEIRGQRQFHRSAWRPWWRLARRRRFPTAVDYSAVVAVVAFRVGGFHGGGVRSSGFAYRGGGYRAAHIYRGGGHRYSGLRYGGARYAYYKPFVHRRHFHRRFYAPSYVEHYPIAGVAGSSGPTTARARSAPGPLQLPPIALPGFY